MELGETGGTKSTHGSLLSGRSKSTRAGCGQSQYSKPYVLFSATDAASATIDFSKSNVDDGIVDSPPSRGLRRSLIVSPSPLRGSQCRPRSDRSSSPTPRSSNTPHRQLYKQCADEAPVDAAVRVQVGCATAAVPVEVDSMIRTFPIRDYPCLEDNLWMVCVDDGREPHIASEVKHSTRGGQHCRPEGNIHLCRSVPSKVGGIVSAGFCRPCHSEGVLPRGHSSGAMEQPPAKSSASRFPLRRLELPCALYNATDSQPCHNLPVRTTSSVGRQKRRDDECFLDWFSRQTSSESLGYISFRQEDIPCVFSKKMKATVVVNEGHRK